MPPDPWLTFWPDLLKAALTGCCAIIAALIGSGITATALYLIAKQVNASIERQKHENATALERNKHRLAYAQKLADRKLDAISAVALVCNIDNVNANRIIELVRVADNPTLDQAQLIQIVNVAVTEYNSHLNDHARTLFPHISFLGKTNMPAVLDYMRIATQFSTLMTRVSDDLNQIRAEVLTYSDKFRLSSQALEVALDKAIHTPIELDAPPVTALVSGPVRPAAVPDAQRPSPASPSAPRS